MSGRPENPFRITKSNDLSDEQIEELWVSVTDDDDITDLVRPSSKMAMYILGGKGSGKSHLMRYHSFPVRLIRYRKQKQPILQAIQKDGYLGVYARCSGMDAARFDGKNVDKEVWEVLFAYYFELWVAEKTLSVLAALVDDGVIGSEADREIAGAIGGLLDVAVEELTSIEHARAFFSKLRREIDFDVNNAAFGTKIGVRIYATRGALFFGVPAIVCRRVSPLKDVIFVYLIDELENFPESKQVFINSLLRDRDGPTAFKIGSRLYGRRTTVTSSGERNRQGAEYEDVFLDQRFRSNPDRYKEFALKLVARRLNSVDESHPLRGGEYKGLYKLFDQPELDWNSAFFSEHVLKVGEVTPPHIESFRAKLRQGVEERLQGAPSGEGEIEEIVSRISFGGYPILEKLCILYLYQRWYRGDQVVNEAREVHERAVGRIEGKKNAKFDEFVQKHKSDLIAQWLRENGQKQFAYCGLSNFIRMSEGLPRALITILKHIHDWATFLDDREPFVKCAVSKEAQQRGIVEASDSFLENMLPDGRDGVVVGTAIERLSELFRINRFADKPIETSLQAFSINMFTLTDTARSVLKMAVESSLLIELPGGQKERNSMSISKKYELNAMLAPRRDLPIARRGVASFKAVELEAVLIGDREGEFNRQRKKWELKMSAPTFGRVSRARRARKKAESSEDLFK